MVGAAVGRRASLSGRGRVRTEALWGGGCCRSPETVREQAVCCLVGGDGQRRGGGRFFREEDGFGCAVCRHFPSPRRHLAVTSPSPHRRHFLPPPAPSSCLSPPVAACVPTVYPPLAYHHPPSATSRHHLPSRRCLPAATSCLPFPPPFPPPCAGRADGWAAAAPRVVGRGAMRRRREVLRNNLENRKILPIFVSVKYRGSGLSRPGFLFFIGLSFLWQKRLSI